MFHTSFLSLRWGSDWPDEFDAVCQALTGWSSLSILLPQDEFLRSDTLSRLALDVGAQIVFTCADAQDVPLLYPALVRAGVTFKTTLTGWLDDTLVRQARKSARPWSSRSIDVGYRAWFPEPWLGLKATAKGEIGARAAEICSQHGWLNDIDTGSASTHSGLKWLEFLGDCRVTVGMEGGSSIADRDGSIRLASQAGHPVPPGRDGEIDLFCLSPRHLEAAATQTVQVLVRGHYSGVLVAGRHYIPVNPDLSDLADALHASRDERLARDLTEAATVEIINAGQWSYSRFARQLDAAVEAAPRLGASLESAVAWEALRQGARRMRVAEALDSRLGSRHRVFRAMASAARVLYGRPGRIAPGGRRSRIGV